MLKWVLLGIGLLLSAAFVGAQNSGERLQVVASHTILADVAQNVAGDAADVSSLMPVDADPHSFGVTPSDLARLAEADAVFVNGLLFEEPLMEQIENAAEAMNLVVASECAEVLPFGAAGHDHDENEPDRAQDGAAIDRPDNEVCARHHSEIAALRESDEHEGESKVEPLGHLYELDCGAGHEHEDEAEGEHEHAEGTCDPHVWMSPENVMLWTLKIRDTLSQLDPANADVYAANAEAYLAALDELAHETLPALLESLPGDERILVTDHDAFGYYANTFDFEIVGIVIPGGSTIAEPNPRDVAQLIETVRAEGVPAVFAGTTVSPDLSRQVANEAGATFHQLYTGSLSAADGRAGTYIDYMIANTQIIVEALSQD